MKWTPFDIKLILHFYSNYDKFPSAHSPIYVERVRALLDNGLIQYSEGVPKTTKLGDAFIDLLLSTPIPEIRYVDPRLPK